jgi:hypothetical protein
MHLRLIPGLGSDGTTFGIGGLNDTSSDGLLILDSDLLQLGGGVQAYRGWAEMVEVRNANGAVDELRSILVEVQLVRDDDSPWTDWIREAATIMPVQPGISRLSGPAMRDVLYFGTAPGNQTLAVSTTKGGLSSLL